MPTIRISSEVFDALKRRAEPLVDTADSVLRRELGLSAEEPGGETGRLLPLLKAGLLKAGDEIEWRRAQRGEVHRATVLATGCIRLPTGQVVSSPSRACSVLGENKSYPGWSEWKRATDGVRLDELRRRAGVSVPRRTRNKT